MLRHLRSQHNWFQLLTAAVLVGGVWQSMPVVALNSDSTPIINQATYTYNDSNGEQPIQGTTSQVVMQLKGELVDPLGRVTGCAGEALPNYTGFSVGLYEPDPNDPTGTEVREPVPLTQTELPDISGNGISIGLAPNTENTNPFFITNGEGGTYNFLFDPNRGQLDRGRTYILLINPPSDSIYNQRRVRLVIGERNGNAVSYTAASLDGKPIRATDASTSITGTINIQNAERVGLVLAVLDLSTSICQAQELQLVKTGDRAAAQPGDTVIYRLSMKNLATSPLSNLVITDTLPVGFNFLPESVRGELGDASVPIAASHNGRTITLRAENITLPGSSAGQNQVLNIAYAAVLTPDAVRGTGRNSAIAEGRRIDNNQSVKDGPATHQLRIEPGILSDCGTLIGRVFEDKNFDGEQQRGEPGVPNAVVFMDDGNRITTDEKGIFSVANVISGYRTGVLDLSSVPGYTLAPNRKFSERNSQSRLVHLEPGGLVRMNFAVTPTSQEGERQ